jgi:hypothetical protein
VFKRLPERVGNDALCAFPQLADVNGFTPRAFWVEAPYSGSALQILSLPFPLDRERLQQRATHGRTAVEDSFDDMRAEQ